MNLDVNQIAPGLYQGSNPPFGAPLRQRGFRTIVLCAAERQYPSDRYPGLRVIRAPMWDSPIVPRDMAHKAARLVAREIRAGRKVLVVCNMGWNRSGIVTALTLWYLTGRPGAECMWAVQMARKDALNNPDFALYLYHLPAGNIRRPDRRQVRAVQNANGL